MKNHQKKRNALADVVATDIATAASVIKNNSRFTKKLTKENLSTN